MAHRSAKRVKQLHAFLEHDGREFWFARLEPACDFGSPFGGVPWVCLLWDAVDGSHGEAGSGLKEQIARQLIESDCQHIICGGADCEDWLRTVVRVHAAGQELQQKSVLTWQADDVAEAAFLMIHLTELGEHEFTRFLVLLLSGDEATEQQLVEAVKHVELNRIHISCQYCDEKARHRVTDLADGEPKSISLCDRHANEFLPPRPRH